VLPTDRFASGLPISRFCSRTRTAASAKLADRALHVIGNADPRDGLPGRRLSDYEQLIPGELLQGHWRVRSHERLLCWLLLLGTQQADQPDDAMWFKTMLKFI
jgi:hypothetical protein